MKNKGLAVKIIRPVGILLFLGVLAYWLIRIFQLIQVEMSAGDENYFGNLQVFLLSWLAVFFFVNLLAWANFKFLFLKWKERNIPWYLFWGLELLLLMVFFEFLQWTVMYEEEILKDNLILTGVVALYFLAITWFFDLMYTRRKQTELIQQKEKAELNLLQSQLNPHFLFNALNSTYSSAIQEESPHTAAQILQLSDLMRFALEKSKKDFISIEEELDFVDKYIRIQKNRFGSTGEKSMDIEINWDGFPVDISPMLVQPFLENAFKFSEFGPGNQNGKILVRISVEEEELSIHIENTYLKGQLRDNKGTGNGIDLVKKRLKSLYPAKHSLTIKDTGKVFTVLMKIDLRK
ncbi:putative sensor protein [Indibacter alkaliphilus LW1]|uniref:Sensor protein n=1 Tax=Indibacter alkaliphilus (strain CCUG 57479 / KCTC 22604 / LW1) TaxID=1189612 RepID=S2D9J3_INDAL|nr:histidine kinase [Indibacter alkaliphilus]EOZ95922.1 putative sensor protein [Indibacter alkaliphilus LW1]